MPAARPSNTPCVINFVELFSLKELATPIPIAMPIGVLRASKQA
jgi:hypothetical protein